MEHPSHRDGGSAAHVTSLIDDALAAQPGRPVQRRRRALPANPHARGGAGQAGVATAATNADWRWVKARNDTPWYPAMRLFRQKTSGDWQTVVAELAQALQRQ
jgi:hypothetical protein